MSDKRINLVLAKHLGTDCERLYRSSGWNVSVGDIVKVESPSLGERFAIVTAKNDYVGENELAFWFKVFDLKVSELKRVLAVATLRNVDYMEDEASDDNV